MKFFAELVLAALAVTAANADKLRSPQSEGNEDDFGFGTESVNSQKYTVDEDVDDPFMVDLNALYGSKVPKKVSILELLGDSKGQVSVDDLRDIVDAGKYLFPSPEKNPQGPHTDINNNVNVKGNNAITDINNNVNIKENDPFTKTADNPYVSDKANDQLTDFDYAEYAKSDGLTPKTGNNVNVKSNSPSYTMFNEGGNVKSGNYENSQLTKIDNTVNVKGGKGGVSVEEDSELDFDESEDPPNNVNKKGGLTPAGPPSATKMVKESGTSPYKTTTLYESGAGGIVNDEDENEKENEDDDNDNDNDNDNKKLVTGKGKALVTETGGLATLEKTPNQMEYESKNKASEPPLY